MDDFGVSRDLADWYFLRSKSPVREPMKQAIPKKTIPIYVRIRSAQISLLFQ
jgi:hypothetical protein